MALVLTHRGTAPRIAADVYLAPNATVVGDVEIGAGASVWFNTVIRGDVFPIRIGARSNIQDLSMVHVTTDRHATTVEEEVTVGHAATLHGCTLRRGCLIGIRAVVLDAAEVGEETIVGAGSVVTPGTILPPRVLAVGTPARVTRPLSDQEIDFLRFVSWKRYVDLAAIYKAG
jgi:carbonic anhydrase/acetyltransferase-like protein (isoleucine patch superfamily)